MFRKINSVITAFFMLCSYALTARADSLVDTQVIYSAEFDSMPTNSAPYGVSVSNSAVYVRENESKTDKYVCHIKKMQSADMSFYFNSSSKDMVYQLDFIPNDFLSSRQFTLLDSSGVSSLAFTVNTGAEVVLPDGRKPAKLTVNRLYRICMVHSFLNGRYDLYLDGKCIASRIAIQNFETIDNPSVLRIKSIAGGYGSKYCVDNIRVYEGTDIADDEAFKREMYNKDSVLLPKDDGAEVSDVQFFSISFDGYPTESPPPTASGGGITTVVTHNTSNLIVVKNIPGVDDKYLFIQKGGSGDPYINLSTSGFNATDAVFEFSFNSADADSVKLFTLRDNNANFSEIFKVAPGGVISVCSKEVAHYETDKWYDVALKLDYTMLTADVYIDGVLIDEKIPFVNLDIIEPMLIRLTMPSSSASGSAYFDNIRFYTGSEFKTDSDFDRAEDEPAVSTALVPREVSSSLAYLRPEAEQLKADFEKNKGVHPRLMATAADFERIRQQSQTDELMKQWRENVLQSADNILGAAHSEYVKPDGTLLAMSRQILDRSQTLGMAYQLTLDERYASYLWDELSAAASFADWNHYHHFLDTAEMTNAFAIGYDWCYDYFTPEQRTVLENAILEKGIKPALKLYDGTEITRTPWIHADHNWNMVCNGGLIVGALGVMDVYPDYSAELMENAFLSLEYMLGEFAPDGGWPEGPNYWNYCVNYLTYCLAALDTAIGTDYGYFSSESITRTGYFLVYSQGSQGLFNFHDSEFGRQANISYLYFAKKLGDGTLMKARMNDMKTFALSGGVYDLLWYDSALAASGSAPKLDALFRNTELVSFRSAFDDLTALYVGMHGGYNLVNHGNMDAGTFVIDALGVRFAEELGADSYGLAGYFNADKFQYYRLGAQGQNVIALNPITEFGQNPSAFAKFCEFETSDRGGYAVLDMTSAYDGKVNYAKRGVRMDSDRTQVVIQDEMNLKTPSDLWWFMHTKADISILPDGKSAILTRDGKRLYAVLQSNYDNAVFQDIAASPLPMSANPSGQASNEALRKLAVNIPMARDDVLLSVRFIPIHGDMMLSDILTRGVQRVAPVKSWKTDEGALSLPELDMIYINGKALDGFKPSQYSYNVGLDFGTESAPLVSVSSASGYDAEIVQPVSANGSCEIKLTDANGSISYYSILFKVMPLIGLVEGYTKHAPEFVDVSSTPEITNPKENAIDGNTSTRWSGSGYSEWLQLDYGKVRDISYITMSFYNGTTRVSYFDIMISEDGREWTTVYSGESSGVTSEYETYYIGDQKARFVRISGRGNSVNAWNSYQEVQAFGK